MKLMHLSDLHLGKRLMDVSLLEDQAYILQQILNLLDAEQPDALLIAGDVYDRANPSADAVQLLDDFLQQPGLRTCGKPWPRRVIGPGVFLYPDCQFPPQLRRVRIRVALGMGNTVRPSCPPWHTAAKIPYCNFAAVTIY